MTHLVEQLGYARTRVCAAVRLALAGRVVLPTLVIVAALVAAGPAGAQSAPPASPPPPPWQSSHITSPLTVPGTTGFGSASQLGGLDSAFDFGPSVAPVGTAGGGASVTSIPVWVPESAPCPAPQIGTVTWTEEVVNGQATGQQTAHDTSGCRLPPPPAPPPPPPPPPYTPPYTPPPAAQWVFWMRANSQGGNTFGYTNSVTGASCTEFYNYPDYPGAPANDWTVVFLDGSCPPG